VHLWKRSCPANFSPLANFRLLAPISADISKGNLLEPDCQFEYLLLRHPYVVVIQRLFLSMREPANLRHCLKNFGCPPTYTTPDPRLRPNRPGVLDIL
jgi:hypothetical protein